jgi:hypothetical protein
MNIPLSALMRPRVDPELDLVAAGIRLPRYVKEALRLASVIDGSPEQRIVAEALKGYLPSGLLDEAYRAAGGGDRS